MAPQQQQKVEHPPSTIYAQVERFLPKRDAVRRNGSCLVAWLPSQWCRAGPCSQRCRPNTPQNGRLQWATRCTTCPEPCSPWQYDAKVCAFRGPPRNFAGQLRVCPLRLRPWLIGRGRVSGDGRPLGISDCCPAPFSLWRLRLSLEPQSLASRAKGLGVDDLSVNPRVTTACSAGRLKKSRTKRERHPSLPSTKLKPPFV